jgi:hypothetical protein
VSLLPVWASAAIGGDSKTSELYSTKPGTVMSTLGSCCGAVLGCDRSEGDQGKLGCAVPFIDVRNDHPGFLGLPERSLQALEPIRTPTSMHTKLLTLRY